jgi:predicted transport protein
MADLNKAMETQVRNLEEKTGKKLAEWVKIVNKMGDLKHGEKVKILKEKHGIGHGNANMLVHVAKGDVQPSGERPKDLVTDQYSKGKEDLRPIFDKLVKEITKFGKDVELSPKKTYVSLRRSRQFGLIQPSTKTRVDVGINLKGVDAKGKLEKSGSWNQMVSHRVRLESPKDVDKDLVGWLKRAYEQA